MNGNGQGELFIILPFYETIESVENNLIYDDTSTQNYDLMKHDRSLVIQDANTVLENDIKSNTDFVFQTDVEPPHIFDFLKRISLHAIKINKNTISLWIDTGAFYNLDNGTESLLNYEHASPSICASFPLKQFCLYHQRDFENRLNKNQQIEMTDVHQKRLLMLDNL